ncbi:FAD-dependent oxidoreductase [Photobacterium lucens]|uniref:FAD-dependent oxidoreductase n=1 Tax=Photobacterium lucens TaxID=2562949 RepID=UPI0013691FBB|nr:FAD-dependent oxidoreductase [Photobacterium lucens]MBP2698813.1 FAD-dependent oxidoreductase [Vibrio parahaemolyticus]MZG56712.1 FAD-dependent oxidoreductase [Photobacterium lucens]MZG79383.1 FAD-dependent oxidoreductase [Photobacterium lucens]
MHNDSHFQPFWFSEALKQESDNTVNSLKHDIQTDVCIVGGGYTGLWTAIQLKQQQPKLDIVIIDKGLCGSGASGRNGGCMLTWSTKYTSMKKLYGEQEAVKLVRASERAVYEIADFCETHNIDADLRVNGTLYTATNKAQQGSMDGVLEQLSKHEVNSWKQWQRERVQQEAGSALHCEGFYSPAAASVQPALLARGLKRVAEGMGIKIYENTPMENISTEIPITITTPEADIFAKKVVLALNAWMLEQFPQFKRNVVLVSSDMAITQPIPEKLNTMGLKDGKTVIDSRIFVHYYRSTSDGRLMLGKGGNYFSFGNKISKVFDSPSRYTNLLRNSFNKLFPSLEKEKFAATWTGASDRSTTGLPFFGHLNDNPNIVYGLGYSGNGVAQTWIGGQILSSLVLDLDNGWSRCGLVSGPKGSFPPEPIRWCGAMMVRDAIRRKENAEDNGKAPFWLDKQLAKFANAAGKADKA